MTVLQAPMPDLADLERRVAELEPIVARLKKAFPAMFEPQLTPEQKAAWRERLDRRFAELLTKAAAQSGEDLEDGAGLHAPDAKLFRRH